MIDLSCKLLHKGWAEIHITDGEQDCQMFASRLSDGLSGFISAVSKLAISCNEVNFSFQEEPGQYRWLLTRADRQVKILIFKFEDTFSKLDNSKGKLVFSGSDELLRFSRSVVRLFDKLKFDYGANGYKFDWTYDFPEKELNLLRESYKNLKSKI